MSIHYSSTTNIVYRNYDFGKTNYRFSADDESLLTESEGVVVAKVVNLGNGGQVHVGVGGYLSTYCVYTNHMCIATYNKKEPVSFELIYTNNILDPGVIGVTLSSFRGVGLAFGYRF
jgi:hypothetical protein